MTATPPDSSIFIIIDVPERGRPETMMISSPYFSFRKVFLMVLSTAWILG